MKVSLNCRFIKGPYGGGMNFVSDLRNFLENKNVDVVDNLNHDDIDVILNINYFPFLLIKSPAYSFFDAYVYKLKRPQTIIITQINECDERKNTNYINKLIIHACKYCDYIVFVASWLKPLLEKQGLNKTILSFIILHGVNEKFFNLKNKAKWNKKDRLKIVTHHWSGNYLKGHDIYQKLDKLLNNKKFKDRFEFTYIGNYPQNLDYENTKIFKPLAGEKLSKQLKKHHVYLTASKSEPAGMHHIEGACCGLPLLYINSGALREYCHGFGLEFNHKNFEKKLWQMYENYDFWFKKIQNYDRTAEKMAKKYYQLMLKLYKKAKNKNSHSAYSSIRIRLFEKYAFLREKIWTFKTLCKYTA